MSLGMVLDPLFLFFGFDIDTLIKTRTTGLMQTHLLPKIEAATRKQFPDGIDEYGADALRFTFASLATTGRDIRFDLGRIEGYKNFCNKLWNASRYVMMNTDSLDDGDVEFSTADRWIRSRMQVTASTMSDCFTSYRLDLAAAAIYDFTWHEFCDWYLELSKPVLQSDGSTDAQKRGTRRTLIEVLESILRMLHPLMPFVTDEIWGQVAPRAGIDGETIMLRPFPQADIDANDSEAEQELEWVQQFILGIRQIRGEMDISPGKVVPVLLEQYSEQDILFAERNALLLQRVGRVESVRPLEKGEDAPQSATALHGNMRLLVPMAGLIDTQAEIERLGKQQEKIAADLARSRGKLENKNFVNNAPAAVVTQEEQRVTEFEQQMAQLAEQLSRLEALK
jgi:valyl-tRNA synthetase